MRASEEWRKVYVMPVAILFTTIKLVYAKFTVYIKCDITLHTRICSFRLQPI